jgi:predicted acetyltransferase
VAYRGRHPVSAAQVFLSHGIAGIYWVGTVEAARGEGLAEAVTRAVGNMAFDQGAGLSSLQASRMGEPIYRRMGYVDVYRCEDYVRWSAARVAARHLERPAAISRSSITARPRSPTP